VVHRPCHLARYRCGPALGYFLSRIEVVAGLLKPYPRLFSFAAAALNLARRLRKTSRRRRAPRPPDSSAGADIELITQNVRGLNIIRCGHMFYAIPQSGGEFSEARAKAGKYQVCVIGTSLKDALRKIGETPNLPPAPKADIIAADVRGFSIIHCGGMFYAIPQDEGAFDMDRILTGEYTRVLAAESEEQVRAALDGGAA